MATPQNTLGAPAEGFSQTVSFAAHLNDRAPSIGDSGGAVADRRQVVGGGRTGVNAPAGVLPPGPSKTADFLFKIADSVIAPKLEKARLERYVGGMQMAAAGKEVTEIADAQPWYTKLFGDGDAVEGARAYTQQTKAQEAALAIEAAMPELRKLGTEEANKYFTGLVQKSLTGDAATDAALMQSFSRVLPASMRKQVREHYIYQQEVASASESAARASGATLLQARAADLATGKTTKEDFEVLQAEFSTLAVPAEGRDKESWQKSMTNDIMLMAERGQFHAVEAFKKLGIGEHLTAHQQAQIERSIEANAVQWRARDQERFAGTLTEMANLERRGSLGLTPEILQAGYANLNQRYREETGNPMGLVSGARIETGMERLSTTIARELDRQALAAARASAAAAAAGDLKAKDQLKEAALATAWANGTLNNIEEITHNAVSHNDALIFARNKMAGLFGRENYQVPLNQQQQQAMHAVARNAIAGGANPLVKTEVLSRLAAAVQNGPGDASGFMSTYTDWKNLNAVAPEAAAAYFGKWDKNMREFDMMYAGQSGAIPRAFAEAFGPTSDLPTRKLAKAELGKHIASAVSRLSDYRPEMLGGRRDLRPGQQEVLVALTQSRAELYRTVPADVASSLGMSAAMQDGLQVIGGYVWQDKVGNVAQRLAAAVTTSTEGGKTSLAFEKDAQWGGAEFGQDFGDVLEAMIKEKGYKGGAANVFAPTDGSLQVTWVDDHKATAAAFTFTEIANRIAELQVSRRKVRKPIVAPTFVRAPQIDTSGIDPVTLLPRR